MIISARAPRPMSRSSSQSRRSPLSGFDPQWCTGHGALGAAPPPLSHQAGARARNLRLAVARKFSGAILFLAAAIFTVVTKTSANPLLTLLKILCVNGSVRSI